VEGLIGVTGSGSSSSGTSFFRGTPETKREEKQGRVVCLLASQVYRMAGSPVQVVEVWSFWQGGYPAVSAHAPRWDSRRKQCRDGGSRPYFCKMFP
jgi:hypothetical protein